MGAAMHGDFGEIVCDGTTQPFSFDAVGDNGTFAGGKAVSITFAFACNDFFCSEDFFETEVQLRRSGGARGPKV